MNALSPSDILTSQEIRMLLAALKQGIKPRDGYWLERCWRRLILFRLSCCCGLRASEIAKLKCGDVLVDGPKPCLRLPRGITKGKRTMRSVPLWWDAGTLEDIAAYLKRRQGDGAGPDDWYLTSMTGRQSFRQKLHLTWKTFTAKVLGEGRARQLTLHCGRHSFASHALHAGRSLIEVRDAMGHLDVGMTSRYSHLIEREGLPDVFGGQ